MFIQTAAGVVYTHGLFFFFLSSAGAWRTSIVADADNFMKISSGIPLQMAATLSINPTTAYRMLKDFVTLKPGIYNVIRNN